MGTRYFGNRWNAPAFDDATRETAPVGERCEMCGEAVTAGDSGTWQSFGGAHGWREMPVHIECWLRQVDGSHGAFPDAHLIVTELVGELADV